MRYYLIKDIDQLFASLALLQKLLAQGLDLEEDIIR
jgi:hypothetical protein